MRDGQLFPIVVGGGFEENRVFQSHRGEADLDVRAVTGSSSEMRYRVKSSRNRPLSFGLLVFLPLPPRIPQWLKTKLGSPPQLLFPSWPPLSDHGEVRLDGDHPIDRTSDQPPSVGLAVRRRRLQSEASAARPCTR